jgi:hypothetical protein
VRGQIVRPFPTVPYANSSLRVLCMRERPAPAASVSQRETAACSVHLSSVTAHSSALLSPMFFCTHEAAPHSGSHTAADSLNIDGCTCTVAGECNVAGDPVTEPPRVRRQD